MANKKAAKVRSKKSGFPCPFCGNKTSNPEAFYSQLKDIVTFRFFNLLNSCNRDSQIEAVLRCIHAVFGSGDPIIRLTLKMAGHLEEFEKKFGSGGEASSYKLRCHKCQKLKDEWEITTDTDSRPFAEYICEDCLSKQAGNP